MRTIRLVALVAQGQPLEPIAQLARLKLAWAGMQAPLDLCLVLQTLDDAAELVSTEGITIRLPAPDPSAGADVRVVTCMSSLSEAEQTAAATWMARESALRVWIGTRPAVVLPADTLVLKDTGLCSELGRTMLECWAPEAIGRWRSLYRDGAPGRTDAHGLPSRSLDRATAHPKLAEALALMKANFEEPLPGDDIARLVGVSRRQLERLFKQHLDTLPSKHYLELRLAHARMLLQDSSQSILQVGLACGFSSGPHFSSTYRAHFGITPREERSRRVSTYWQAGSTST